ncbi:hypothetical protein ABVK25_006843 [Lepraria finkii]|uniref:Uncharacterized protein n=1 Tax=Lepraria finkii TaxID=1340010 RepID=A0ABR4B4V7_9LECA
MVLVSGKTVEANPQSHSDLFHALRGGNNNNYGIITRFDMQKFPPRPNVRRLCLLHLERLPRCRPRLHQVPPELQPRSIRSCHCGGQLHSRHEIRRGQFLPRKAQPNPTSLAPFVAIQPQLTGTVREDSLLGLSMEQSSFSPDSARSWFSTTTWQAYLDLMMAVRTLGAEVFGPLSASVPGFVLAMAFQSLRKVY